MTDSDNSAIVERVARMYASQETVAGRCAFGQRQVWSVTVLAGERMGRKHRTAYSAGVSKRRVAG